MGTGHAQWAGLVVLEGLNARLGRLINDRDSFDPLNPEDKTLINSLAELSAATANLQQRKAAKRKPDPHRHRPHPPPSRFRDSRSFRRCHFTQRLAHRWPARGYDVAACVRQACKQANARSA